MKRNKEGGYYARNFGWNKPVAFDRGGYLTRIDYGQRASSIFSAPAPAPASGAFSVAERCFDEDEGPGQVPYLVRHAGRPQLCGR